MEFTNQQVAKLLREVAVAHTLKKGNIFQIRAYETAADVIEHSSEEVKDLWEEKRLDDLPGIGESLKDHFDELFKTGKVGHWGAVKRGIPKETFRLLDVPGVGPKTALKLVKLGVKDVDDLKDKLQVGSLVKKGFSDKLAKRILSGVEEVPAIKNNRMLLPYAVVQANRVLAYLRRNSEIERVDTLGSLRRMVPTIGDLDFAVASKDPEKAIKCIASMPGVARVVDEGERNITVALASGLHLDFIVVQPTSYGALLQHFTGSKLHNVHLRTLAEEKGYSLSEYGVKNKKTGELIHTKIEEELYSLLGMETPPPEIREDTGEIEAALKHQLPKLVEFGDIRGDLHIHSSFPIEPSHDLGAGSIKEIAGMAKKLGYSYVGISDHNPSQSRHNESKIIELIRKRNTEIEHINSSLGNVRVLKLLEVDILPNGVLAVPEEGLKLLDFAMAGVHSLHRQPKEQMTKRILRALGNAYVKVLTHPTGRLLNKRESYQADWEQIFKFAAKNKKALEINAYSDRLDLPDNLVRMAKNLGVKFVINTDSHQVSQMENMKFGVAVARRGWATKEDIINTWDWTRLTRWFSI